MNGFIAGIIGALLKIGQELLQDKKQKEDRESKNKMWEEPQPED